LEGREGRHLLVAAECTASVEAKGTLRDRMNKTLEKLIKIKARYRYYFVATKKMETAARNRVVSGEYKIEVVRLE
jgi:hypothetical protein